MPEKLQINKNSLAPSQTTKIESKDSATNIVPEIGSHQFGYLLREKKKNTENFWFFNALKNLTGIAGCLH